MAEPVRFVVAAGEIRRAVLHPSPPEVLVILVTTHSPPRRRWHRAMQVLLSGAIIAGVSGGIPVPAWADTPVARVEGMSVSTSRAGTVRTGLRPFALVGARWSGGGSVEVRIHDDDGWTPWAELELAPEEGPDPATGEPAPIATEPLWVGEADGFAVRTAGAVTDLRMFLVRSTTERRPVPGAGASVASATPPAVARGFTIRTRGEWAARPPKSDPSYTSIEAAVVHHTVNSNDYAPGDVPGILRAIQAYHMDANGWNDIAYNFLVDRFGQAWEGRGGGIDQPVLGGHTLGFNTGTVGVAAIGDFTSVDAPAGLVSTITDLVGWKLALSGVDPTATTELTNRAPNHPRYAEGQQVRVPTVFAHRDTSPTGCPGSRLYARVAQIRNDASQRFPYILGSVDAASFAAGGVRVRGWTIARGTVDPLSVHVIVDGRYAAADLANRQRPDIDSAYPSYGGAHGYDLVAPAGPGPHVVCVFGINDGDGRNYQLGCQSVFLPADPMGSFDALARAPGGLRVRGWALDPEVSSSIPVDFYLNGVMVGRVTASGERPDVASSYPTYGSRHGYDVVVAAPAANGPATVCAYAINMGQAGSSRGLGCQTVRVGHEPFGSLDAALAQVRGWAIDPDVAGPIYVDLYVNGAWGGRHLANRSRPDVGAAYPGWGSLHGFEVTLPAAPTPGSVICAYAINAGAGGSNPVLGCLRL